MTWSTFHLYNKVMIIAQINRRQPIKIGLLRELKHEPKKLRKFITGPHFVEPEYHYRNVYKIFFNLVKSEIHNSCFPLYLEKVRKGAKLLETKTMVIGQDAIDFGSPFKFFIYYYRQYYFDVAVFVKKYSRFKISIDFDLHHRDYLLKALDGQTQCNHFGENFIKIR